MKLSEKLFDLRRKAGLSQEELADKIGVSRQAVGKWENGASVPELEKLIALSEFYAIPIGELLGIEQPPRSDEAAPVFDTSELEEILRDLARRQITGDEGSKRARKWLWAALGAAFCGMAVMAVVFGVRIAKLDRHLRNLNSTVVFTQRSLTENINSMQFTIAGLIEDQTRIFSDCDYEQEELDPSTGLITTRICATPKAMTDTMTVTFTLEPKFGGSPESAEASLRDGRFTASLSLPAGDYSLSASVAEEGSSVREELGDVYLSKLNFAQDCYVYWFDSKNGLKEDEGGSTLTKEGTLLLLPSAGQSLESAELRVFVNGEQTAARTLELEDESCWTDDFIPPESDFREINYVLPDGSPAAQSRPASVTADEGGLLYRTDLSFEIPALKEGDRVRGYIVVKDSLGIWYVGRAFAADISGDRVSGGDRSARLTPAEDGETELETQASSDEAKYWSGAN